LQRFGVSTKSDPKRKLPNLTKKKIKIKFEKTEEEKRADTFHDAVQESNHRLYFFLCHRYELELSHDLSLFDFRVKNELKETK
jgi:hypothetical protein